MYNFRNPYHTVYAGLVGATYHAYYILSYISDVSISHIIRKVMLNIDMVEISFFIKSRIALCGLSQVTWSHVFSSCENEKVQLCYAMTVAQCGRPAHMLRNISNSLRRALEPEWPDHFHHL